MRGRWAARAWRWRESLPSPRRDRRGSNEPSRVPFGTSLPQHNRQFVEIEIHPVVVIANDRVERPELGHYVAAIRRSVAKHTWAFLVVRNQIFIQVVIVFRQLEHGFVNQAILHQYARSTNYGSAQRMLRVHGLPAHPQRNGDLYLIARVPGTVYHGPGA